jgi:hypothetical protein
VGGFSDGVVVVAGTAIDVFGPFSSTESVIVAPVVISDVVTGPGGAGCGVSAANVAEREFDRTHGDDRAGADPSRCHFQLPRNHF